MSPFHSKCWPFNDYTMSMWDYIPRPLLLFCTANNKLHPKWKEKNIVMNDLSAWTVDTSMMNCFQLPGQSWAGPVSLGEKGWDSRHMWKHLYGFSQHTGIHLYIHPLLRTNQWQVHEAKYLSPTKVTTTTQDFIMAKLVSPPDLTRLVYHSHGKTSFPACNTESDPCWGWFAVSDRDFGQAS